VEIASAATTMRRSFFCWIGSSRRRKPGAFGGVYEKILSPKLSDSADAHRVLPQKPKLESLNLGHTFLAKAMRILR
jgi:hypothetical protein